MGKKRVLEVLYSDRIERKTNNYIGTDTNNIC
jgi:hypothetical protein